MLSVLRSPKTWSVVSAIGLVGIMVGAGGMAQAAGGDPNRTGMFSGKKVNAGVVMHEHKDGKHMLTLSDDFQVPDAPDPHWQVVDSKGRAYLLQRLNVKGLVSDKLNRMIMLPDYVVDIAKVQIWCAYAEVVLGEASFDKPIK